MTLYPFSFIPVGVIRTLRVHVPCEQERVLVPKEQERVCYESPLRLHPDPSVFPFLCEIIYRSGTEPVFGNL
jgi:hypothetical protein